MSMYVCERGADQHSDQPSATCLVCDPSHTQCLSISIGCVRGDHTFSSELVGASLSRIPAPNQPRCCKRYWAFNITSRDVYSSKCFGPFMANIIIYRSLFSHSDNISIAYTMIKSFARSYSPPLL